MEVTPIKHTDHTAAELEDLPTLAQGQADDLKIEDGDYRVWLSRCTIEDGEPFNDAITVEVCINGSWIEGAKYPG